MQATAWINFEMQYLYDPFTAKQISSDYPVSTWQLNGFKNLILPDESHFCPGCTLKATYFAM